jgi:hypothetical protein
MAALHRRACLVPPTCPWFSNLCNVLVVADVASHEIVGAPAQVVQGGLRGQKGVDTMEVGSM